MSVNSYNPEVLGLKKGDHVIVIGAGVSGQACAKLLMACGLKVKILEKSYKTISPIFIKHLEESGGCVFFGEHLVEHFVGAKLVVLSPGIPLQTILPLLEKANISNYIGEIELANKFLNQPIIAVTGTSGKTTTASLIAAMLTQHGLRVFLGGNIGVPLAVCALQTEKPDVIVLEVSSFQLQTSTSLHPKVSVLLNISENHLDYHTDMAEYIAAKVKIFENQTADDVAILSPLLHSIYEQSNFKAKPIYIEAKKRFSHEHLPGIHNDYNIEAAYQASKLFGVTKEEANLAIKNFMPLRHRLEIVLESNEVTYVNDSKGTTVEALTAALNSFMGSIILISGGRFKGGNLEELGDTLKNRVKHVILFGEDRLVFSKAWQAHAPIEEVETLAEAVLKAHSIAKAKDIVLFSPAASSFDQYANYEERGNHFCELIKGLNS